MTFPDLSYLQQLQTDLWRWPRPRAAVMVGAGLSLNAEPLPGVNTPFPTWRQLVRSMFAELHPSGPAMTCDSANPLRIASEYEAAFGRRKLDLLIRRQIPDSQYVPGRLHRLLMQLPWADVFTTNYDTLLERTEVDGRTYQPVTKPSELTTASAPRIIKLHGSFPSQTPFIISEEDYRTYPLTFAPFVNSVRQSLLENSFVLVGFSGEDPNFLEWTGWIRDELGSNHAPIYLMGPLSLGRAERSLLERRGVTPIDLSPLFTGLGAPDRVYADSIEWCLTSLSAARPPRKEKWPEFARPKPSATPGLHPVLGISPIPEEIKLPSRSNLTTEVVSKLVERWRFERAEYPGWVIAPAEKRTLLWLETKFWFLPLTDFVKNWPATDRVLLFKELNWRLETAMAPLVAELIGPFERAIDEILPLLIQGQAVFSPVNLAPSSTISNSEIARAWLELAFGLLRDARESYDAVRWTALKAKIDEIASRHPVHSDRNQYETALWAMWNVDRARAKNILSQWQPSTRSPLAAIRKAALLAELDELGEARPLLRSALLEIRRALRSQGQNIELLSLEGWCTYLLACVEPALDPTKFGTVLDEFSERWHELKAWDCDPWPHKEYFDNALAADPPEPQKLQEEVRGFDPGQVSVRIHVSDGDPTRYLPGFACIRFYEQVGLPMRLPWIDITGSALKNACRWIAPFTGFWSPAVLVRAGKVRDLSEGNFLSRTQVAAMAPTLAGRLYAWCAQILERELASLVYQTKVGSAQESLLEVLAEVLSRLAFRIESSELKKTFPLVLCLYRQPAVQAHPRLHGACEPWFRRLFDAADLEALLDWLPDLIQMPLLDGNAHVGLPAHDVSPDPMRCFPSWRIREAKSTSGDKTARIRGATDWLLRRAASESGEARRRAIERLAQVDHASLVTADQQRHLGTLLWAEATAGTLPARPGFAVFGFLHLPAPEGIDVSAIIKSYILALPSKSPVERDASGRTLLKVGLSHPSCIFEAALASKPVVRLISEKLGTVEWTQEEAKQLYLKARNQWANHKLGVEFAKDSPFGPIGSVETDMAELGQFLARVVLPHMGWADEEVWLELLAWLGEARNVGVFPSVALPYVLLHRPAEVDIVGSTISEDVRTDVEDKVAAASKAIRHWIHLAAIGRVPQPPPRLLRGLLERVVFRRKPGIHSCLWQLACLVFERQESITPSDAALLSASLSPWHDATVLPMQGGSGDFREAERPDVRAKVGCLAGALRIWYARRSPSEPEPPAIAMWQQLCASDPLPEIRRAFDAWNEAS